MIVSAVICGMFIAAEAAAVVTLRLCAARSRDLVKKLRLGYAADLLSTMVCWMFVIYFTISLCSGITDKFYRFSAMALIVVWLHLSVRATRTAHLSRKLLVFYSTRASTLQARV